MYSVAVMAHPFRGSPTLPFDTVKNPPSSTPKENIYHDLANLPQPRKHYKLYYSTPHANEEMMEPKSELHTFLRGYFHLKSDDWEGNNPEPLKAWTATELAKMPYYYILPLQYSMREAVAHDMASEDTITLQKKSSRWLPDAELAVYVNEWARTGFQGGLNWYRVATDPQNQKDVEVFAGKKIEVPYLYIAGKKDWGSYQEPGAIDKMSDQCIDMRGVKLIEGAGHWVQQEQPEKLVEHLIDFLGGL
jgi:pimeloyl-ACP methyl ester carboxylesterase